MTFRDPLMLLSLLNTKLRDTYKTLEDLCYDENIDQKELLEAGPDGDHEVGMLLVDVLNQLLTVGEVL